MIENFKELNKILRNLLIQQTGLPSENVLNGLSIYGAALEKRLQDQKYNSFEPSDSVIVFELALRNSSSDVNMTNDNDYITSYSSYSLNLVIYGNAASQVANLVWTRFQTESIRLVLQSYDIYLEDVSKPSSVNEFVNTTMWHRADLSINITCKTQVSQVEVPSSFDLLGKLNTEALPEPKQEPPVSTIGSIQGFVKYKEQFISDASVTLINDATQQTYNTLSQQDGSYLFENLQYGLYEITASAQGYVYSYVMSLTLDSKVLSFDLEMSIDYPQMFPIRYGDSLFLNNSVIQLQVPMDTEDVLNYLSEIVFEETQDRYSIVVLAKWVDPEDDNNYYDYIHAIKVNATGTIMLTINDPMMGEMIVWASQVDLDEGIYDAGWQSNTYESYTDQDGKTAYRFIKYGVLTDKPVNYTQYDAVWNGILIGLYINE